jgi:Kdo2-lipid IVA lauroyltransferase/acyltransferase
VAKYYFFSRELAKRRPGLNRIGWRIEAWAIAALIGVFRMLPLERATRFAHWLFTFGASSKQRQRVMRNLYVAFPDTPADELGRIARDIFGNVGVALAEIAQIGAIWKDRAKRLEFVAAPDARILHEGGRPAVFVTAHIGPWTLTNFLAAQYEFPLSIVYAAESNPYVHDMMLRLRSELPARLLARDNSMRTLIKELGSGAAIGLGSDVRLDGGEMIPFFGHDMPTNTVPARLALRFDCELIPARAQRLPGGRFRITAYPPVVASDPAASAAEQAADMTAKLNVLFEQWIRETPGEWLCLARRWPKETERAAEKAALERAARAKP